MSSETEHDWREVRFRRGTRSHVATSEDNASARFIVGTVLFVVVALAYPWYSCWVQSRLLATDVQQAAQQLEADARKELQAMNEQMQDAVENQQAQAEARRINAVRVLGASTSGGLPVVIVNLGSASMHEATPAICQQASGWVGRSVAGAQIRVQRYRGRQPALDAGTIRC